MSGYAGSNSASDSSLGSIAAGKCFSPDHMGSPIRFLLSTVFHWLRVKE